MGCLQKLPSLWVDDHYLYVFSSPCCAIRISEHAREQAVLRHRHLYGPSCVRAPLCVALFLDVLTAQTLQLCTFVRGERIDLSTLDKVVAATYVACKMAAAEPEVAGSEASAAWQWSGLLSTQAKSSRCVLVHVGTYVRP